MHTTDKANVDEVVTKHLGHFNASVAWLIENDIHDAPRIADTIQDSDSSATLYMTGQRGYVCDYDEWRPKLVKAVEAMLRDI